MNGAIKRGVVVERYHNERSEEPQTHIVDLINAYTIAGRLKTLRGLILNEGPLKISQSEQ